MRRVEVKLQTTSEACGQIEKGLRARGINATVRPGDLYVLRTWGFDPNDTEKLSEELRGEKQRVNRPTQLAKKGRGRVTK